MQRAGQFIGLAILIGFCALCLVRRFGWRDTVVLTWPSFGALLFAAVLGATTVGMALWLSIGNCDPSARTAVGLLGAVLMGALGGTYLLGGIVELAAFRGASPALEWMTLAVTSRSRGRGINGPSASVSTELGGMGVQIPISAAQYARIRVKPVDQCLLVHVQYGRDGVVRAVIAGTDAQGHALTPTLVGCREALPAQEPSTLPS